MVYTAGVHTGHDGWRAAVAEQHGQLGIVVGHERYRCRIAWQRSARFGLVRWSGDQEFVRRSAADVRRDPRERVSLFAPLRGRASVEQGGRRVELGPDAMVMCPSDQPTEFQHGSGFAALSLLVPEAAVAARWRSARAPMALLDRKAGLGRVAFESVRVVWAERAALGEREFEVACERAVDLLCLAAVGAPDAGIDQASAVAASVRRFVDDHAGDPSLDSATIAAALGWSRRYVQAALQATGTTPTELIRDVRLDRARVRLEQGGGIAVGVVARECGFSSPGAFSTAFRRRFGVRPMDVRR